MSIDPVIADVDALVAMKWRFRSEYKVSLIDTGTVDLSRVRCKEQRHVS